jgi:hypothetical protein
MAKVVEPEISQPSRPGRPPEGLSDLLPAIRTPAGPGKEVRRLSGDRAGNRNGDEASSCKRGLPQSVAKLGTGAGEVTPDALDLVWALAFAKPPDSPTGEFQICRFTGRDVEACPT